MTTEPDWKPYKALGHKYEISSDFRLRKKPDSNQKNKDEDDGREGEAVGVGAIPIVLDGQNAIQ